jgi:PhzF family phenazine biosynthesis protein
MSLPLFHVDAFTDRPFAGNPAAVCLLPAWTADRWFQTIAREMNLSETAFLVKQPDHLVVTPLAFHPNPWFAKLLG